MVSEDSAPTWKVTALWNRPSVPVLLVPETPEQVGAAVSGVLQHVRHLLAQFVVFVLHRLQVVVAVGAVRCLS